MRVGSFGALAAAFGALSWSMVSPAAAAGETNIDYVEVSQDGVVSVLFSADGLPSGAPVGTADVMVTLDGKRIPATTEAFEEGTVARTTVLALDSSLSMNGDKFEAAKQAAHAFVRAAPEDVRIGLLPFSAQVQHPTSPTLERDLLHDAIDDLGLSYGTALYDAVAEASQFAGTEGSRSLLILSDGRDGSSRASLQDVTAAAAEDGIVIDVVAIQQDPEALADLSAMADATGGRVVDARSNASLEEVFAAQAAALASQLIVTFDLPSDAGAEGTIAVTVSQSGQAYTDTAFVPLKSSDLPGDGPAVVEQAQPLLGGTGLWIGAAALALGLAGVLAMVLPGAKPKRALEQQMAFYSTQSDGSAAELGADRSSGPSMRESAVAVTQKLVQGDFESRLLQRLNGAGLALTPAEWLLLHTGVALAAAFVGLIVRGPAMMVVLFIAGVLVPWMFLKFKHARRLAAFNSQLAETLQLVAGGLSAGLSMPQAIDTVVREGVQPMAGELRRALTEQRLGIEIEEALQGVADRMESQDFSWVVMAIRIQREVGGNLAELLNTVADTLRERDYLRRQVKVLSAEGRFSAWILGGMPIAMFIFLLLVRPHAVEPLYTEPMGLMLSGLAIVLLAMGFVVMSKLVKVEV